MIELADHQLRAVFRVTTLGESRVAAAVADAQGRGVAVERVVLAQRAAKRLGR